MNNDPHDTQDNDARFVTQETSSANALRRKCHVKRTLTQIKGKNAQKPGKCQVCGEHC
jgi:hypothetical protein